MQEGKVDRASQRDGSAAGIVCVVITLLGWSSVLLFLRHLAPLIDVWTSNGWRYGSCALFLFPFLIGKRGRGSVPADIWLRALPPAVLNSAGQVCFAASIYFIEPGLAGFLLRVALISSTLGAFVLFADERVLIRTRIFWFGMLFVIAGSVGTVLFGVLPIRGATAIGIALGAAAGAFFGLYGVAVRYWMRGISSIHSFAAISTYTALAMVALMIWRGKEHGLIALQLSPLNLTILFGSALIGIALGHIFYYASIARLGVAVAGAVVQLAPFLGGAASVMVFDEVLTAGQWISGFVLLLGGMVLLRAERRRPRVLGTGGPRWPIRLEHVGGPTPISVGSARSPDDAASPRCAGADNVD